ncbi:2-keto-4-pentenoate hydratase [Herbiconiux ginsengi]|uniref:2-keto-4-pentenoate hydratase n=1 Tax=Herbiconiux ginsengi TaxID=381665 RepID=A0A1H3MRI1_9MICO|nr:fumarylacetoacetate hydrolase family protein [Herbiconiux ginsengi]SDY79120.1 2-keto-4-pentenoate hydratase [Herbiconiux ginsengi]
MTTLSHTGIAEELIAATRGRTVVQPLRKRFPALTLDDAYAIQVHQLDARRRSGSTLVGRKIGLTSTAMQRQLGIDSPDFGFVLDDMVYSDGDSIPLDRFVAPRVEPELAFVLRHSLSGPGVDREEALAAVEYVFAAIEIIDSRIADWDIGLLDTVADNASCGAIVVAREPMDIDVGHTRSVEVDLHRNGEIVDSGRGDAVLGDPLQPLVWLANVLGEHGATIQAGEIVLTGSFCRAAPVVRGDRVTADFRDHGSLTIDFT